MQKKASFIWRLRRKGSGSTREADMFFSKLLTKHRKFTKDLCNFWTAALEWLWHSLPAQNTGSSAGRSCDGPDEWSAPPLSW